MPVAVALVRFLLLPLERAAQVVEAMVALVLQIWLRLAQLTPEAVAVAVVAVAHRLAPAKQAALALSSSSTTSHHRLLLLLKHPVLGLARQV
jgi:hypothetical protein